MWALLRLPRFRGAIHANDHDNRSRHCQVVFEVHGVDAAGQVDIRPLPIAGTVVRMQPMTRAQLCLERAEHMLNVRVLTDELADELPKNSHGTDLTCGRKCRLHGGLGLVDLSGIEPLTSSLRTRCRAISLIDVGSGSPRRRLRLG